MQTVNFIKEQTLNFRLYRDVCNYMGKKYHNFLLYIEGQSYLSEKCKYQFF